MDRRTGIASAATSAKRGTSGDRDHYNSVGQLWNNAVIDTKPFAFGVAAVPVAIGRIRPQPGQTNSISVLRNTLSLTAAISNLSPQSEQ